MTREEAIKWLKELETMKFAWDGAMYHEAVGMAIEMIENSKRPTNLEHYFYDWTYDDDRVVITFEEDMTNEFIFKDKSWKLKEWLLKPYEPPKYKVSQFEYDLLASFNEISSNGKFKNNFVLIDLQDKGYFKEVDGEEKIRDVLENCEVTNDD